MQIEYEVERVIVEYLGAHYGIEPDEITDESTLDYLEVDSLGVLAIADIVENKYGISLNDERIAGVRTLRLQGSHRLEDSRNGLRPARPR